MQINPGKRNREKKIRKGVAFITCTKIFKFLSPTVGE